MALVDYPRARAQFRIEDQPINVSIT
jgi:hypothetical protein